MKLTMTGGVSDAMAELLRICMRNTVSATIKKGRTDEYTLTTLLFAKDQLFESTPTSCTAPTQRSQMKSTQDPVASAINGSTK